jgi:hypothetical protein
MVSSHGRIKKTNSKWQDSKAKRYFVWVCLGYQEKHVRLKDFLQIVLLKMEFKNTYVVFMVVRILIILDLGIELEKVDLKKIIIHMRLGLDNYVL